MTLRLFAKRTAVIPAWLWLALAAAAIVVMLLAIIHPGPAPHPPYLRAIGMLEDPTTRLSLADVREMHFAPSDGVLAEGYTRSAFWFRFTLDRPAEGDGTVILRPFPPILDSITVYRPAPQDSPAETGTPAPMDRVDATARPQDYLRGTAVQVPPGGTEVFVRIASVGSMTGNIAIMTPHEALDAAIRSDFAQIAYLTFLAVLLAWSVRMHVLTRDRLFLAFALVQSVWLPFNLIYFGYLPAFIGPWHDWQFDTLRYLSILNTVVAFLFHRAVLLRHDPPKVAVRMLEALTAVSGLTLPVFLAGERALALQINGLCIFAFPFLIIAMVAAARRDAGAGLLALRLVYALFCGSLFLWIFTLMGLGRGQVGHGYYVMLHGLSTGLLMFILLRLHGNGLLASLRQAEASLVAAETQRRVERRHSEMRLRFIDMLAHETRNALAVITMSLAGQTFGDRQRARIRDTIADLESIIDRSTQLAQLQHDDADVALAGFDLVRLAGTIRSTTEEGYRIELHAPPDLWVQSDPVLVKVILSNLVENALKYSADGSPVTVRLSRHGDTASITVENRASAFGMPDPARVFGKFYRGEKAQARFGSGLGLNIARHLATVLGGTIHYRPEGDTVRFTVDLPC